MKIGFETFFDFNDDTPIKDALKQFDNLEKAYQGMISGIEESNQQLAGEFVAVQNAAEGLVKTVTGMGASMQKNEKVLVEASHASETLVKNYVALKTAQTDNSKVTKTLQTQLDSLTKSKEEASKATNDETGSLNDLRKRLAEAEAAYKTMGDASDNAIKDTQIEKVRALAYEYNASNSALKEARKGVLVAAGSYDELSKQVAEAKKDLKAMEGGIDGTSDEFKQLQKFVSDNTEKLKKWDKAVGDNQRSVRDYGKALEGMQGNLGRIAPEFGQVIEEVKGLGKAFYALATNPVGAIIIAIAAALGALMAYFKGSIEGQDDFNKVLKVGEAILETFMAVIKDLGKAIFEALTHPKETLQALIDLLKPLTEAFTQAFEHPIDTLKKLGDAILENVFNRLKAIPLLFQAIGKIFKSGFTDGFKDLGNALAQEATGVTKLLDKTSDAIQVVVDGIKKMADETMAAFKARVALGNQISALENQLRKDRIADIIDDARTELQVGKLLLESKDKLRFSDEERFNKLREANQKLQDQLEGDLKLARDEIALQKLNIKQDGETYESRQKLVELQAAEVALQSKFYQERKRRQQAEIALINEMTNDIIAQKKREEDAETALNSFRLNETVRTNQKILANEESSLGDRLQAITDMDHAQEKLLQDNRDKALEAEKEAALARIDLDGDTLDKIYSREDISIKDRIALVRSEKEKLLGTDVAYTKNTIKIQEDYQAKSDQLLEDGKKAAEDNVFKVLDRDAAIFADNLDKGVNEKLTALNEAFANGDVSSLEDFEKQKLKIQEEGQTASLNSQIEYLKTRAALLDEGSKERAAVEKSISELELQLSQQSADKRIEVEKKIQDAVTNLKQVAFQGALQIIDQQNAAADADRNNRLDKLSQEQSAQLALVKDDEQAKALIQAEFAARKKKIDDEQRQANRRRAIFEKALAITEIGINTAKGVSQALGDYPPPASFVLAALVAAAGAVQIGVVASKPIPSFAVGTENSPEGLAIVNELGPEIIVDKSGKARMIGTDGPTLTYLKKGSRIITASETAKHLDYLDMQNESGILRNGISIVRETARVNMDKVTEAIGQSTEQLTNAIGKIPQDYFDDKGYRRFERGVNGRVMRLDTKYKF
jgi:hypothetical protein